MDSTLSTLGSSLSLSVREAVSQAVQRSSPGPPGSRAESRSTEQLREQQRERLQEQLRGQNDTEDQSAAHELETAAPVNRALRFRLNREAERIYIQVVDQNTGEIVKQIPPERLLKLAESLRQATGNLLDESA